MRYAIITIIGLMPLISSAQRFHGDLYAGAANYQGDLQSKVFTFEKAGVAGGLGVSYDLTNRFIIRAATSFARIQGNDKYNSGGKGVEARNLNFKTNIIEGQIALEFNILDLSYRSFSPYVFAGGAVYHFNPYTFDTDGSKIFLQPLGTEGQGLPQYPDKKPYKLTQFAVPLGGGIKLALSEKIQMGVEMGFRKLFHDYLDDVSTIYADSSILAAARGPRAVGLAYRGDELTGGGNYPAATSERGNPKMKDWYYITGFRISYLFGTGSADKGRKTKTGCPGNVY